jgi:arginine/lysine/ornithine decarboxylase
LPDPDKVRIRVYATQSTHKTLTSLRQGSMIHIWDEDYQRKSEDSFHEAYMAHTSTSPNYQILASLDVGRRQVEFEGYELVEKAIEQGMLLRHKINDHPKLRRYFDIVTVEDMVPRNTAVRAERVLQQGEGMEPRSKTHGPTTSSPWTPRRSTCTPARPAWTATPSRTNT